MSEPILYTYKPREGAFIIGVPQRDLTAKDVRHAGPGAMRDAIASGLYEKAKASTADADKPAAAKDEVKP